MEFASDLADVKGEAYCHICQEYFTNPVTIKCGHNFCLPCISASWKDITGTFPCPSCHFHCPEKNFSSNHQLGNLTELAKLVPGRSHKRKRQEVSPKDLEAFCPLCNCPTNPRPQQVRPVVQAALCGAKQFQKYVELWRNKVEPVEKVCAMQKRKLQKLERMVGLRKERIKNEFDQLKLFLQNDRETILGQLKDEQVAILAKVNENLTAFSEHYSALKDLLKETQSQCVNPDLELLENVKDICHRYENLKCPETFSFTIKSYHYQLFPQYSGLDRIIKLFKVDVILDPETAHSRLHISEDRKTVRYGNRQKLSPSPGRFYFFPAVLGSKGYCFDRQYWEVDVSNKTEWVLGVYTDSLTRRSQNKPILGQDGIWGVGLCNQTNYIALGPKKTNLLPKVIPSKIGIFLDSKMGEVSFYNLNDNSLLHAFSDCGAGKCFWPYFNTGTDLEPLKICT